jgi:hypothetical protein
MPYAQGELDGLCGVYAIVNAVEASVAGWNKVEAESLFQHLVTRLSLKRRFAFARRVPLSSYWQRLQEHLQGRSHTAIIGLWVKYEHWSCVHSMSERTVHLSDSRWNPIQRVYRANCTTGRIKGRGRHELAPTQSVLILVAEIWSKK